MISAYASGLYESFRRSCGLQCTAGATRVTHQFVTRGVLPPQFICPLTHRTLRYPVRFIGDAQAYEQDALVQWVVQDGRATDPATQADRSERPLERHGGIQQQLNAFRQALKLEYAQRGDARSAAAQCIQNAWRLKHSEKPFYLVDPDFRLKRRSAIKTGVEVLRQAGVCLDAAALARQWADDSAARAQPVIQEATRTANQARQLCLGSMDTDAAHGGGFAALVQKLQGRPNGVRDRLLADQAALLQDMVHQGGLSNLVSAAQHLGAGAYAGGTLVISRPVENFIYHGDWQDGPHGLGVCTKKNVLQYAGQFNDGEPQGLGISFHAGQPYYAGRFAASQALTGELSLGNHFYAGEVSDGAPTGLGRLQQGDTEFIGKLMEGQPQTGVWNFFDDTVSRGRACGAAQWVGQVTYATGNRYAGQFEGDTPQGFGALQTGPLQLIGSWVNGGLAGPGGLRRPGGRVHVGVWESTLFFEDRGPVHLSGNDNPFNEEI
jgi:hypothetical protein